MIVGARRGSTGPDEIGNGLDRDRHVPQRKKTESRQDEGRRKVVTIAIMNAACWVSSRSNQVALGEPARRSTGSSPAGAGGSTPGSRPRTGRIRAGDVYRPRERDEDVAQRSCRSISSTPGRGTPGAPPWSPALFPSCPKRAGKRRGDDDDDHQDERHEARDKEAGAPSSELYQTPCGRRAAGRAPAPSASRIRREADTSPGGWPRYSPRSWPRSRRSRRPERSGPRVPVRPARSAAYTRGMTIPRGLPPGQDPSRARGSSPGFQAEMLGGRQLGDELPRGRASVLVNNCSGTRLT